MELVTAYQSLVLVQEGTCAGQFTLFSKTGWRAGLVACHDALVHRVSVLSGSEGRAVCKYAWA